MSDNGQVKDRDTMTVGDLRELLTDDVPDAALVLVSEYSEHSQGWIRVGVVAAEVRRGFNAAPVLVVTTDDPDQALM